MATPAVAQAAPTSAVASTRGMRIASRTVSCCSLKGQGGGEAQLRAQDAQHLRGRDGHGADADGQDDGRSEGDRQGDEPPAAPAYDASSGWSSRARSAMALPVRGPKPSR